MRLKELLTEAIDAVDIDWEKFKAGMTAYHTASYGNVPDLQRIDGLVFLGIMGAPGSSQVWKPVRIGRTVPGALDPNLGQYWHDKNRNIQGEYVGSKWNRKELGDVANYDIVIRDTSLNPAKIENSVSTIAHELRHRGFHMVRELPEVMNRLGEPLKGWVENALYVDGTGIFDYFKFDKKDRQSVEHLLMYSVEMGDDNGQVGPLDKLGDSSMFRSVEEIRTFRKLYWKIANAAREYILTQPIPEGGLKSLRDAVEAITPPGDEIKLTTEPGGKIKITAVAPANTTQPGVKDSVMAIQSKLKKLGADLGTFGPNRDGVDGALGDKTIQAIRSYLTQKLSGQ